MNQRQPNAAPLMSEAVDQLFDAYVTAQAEIDNVTQDREVEVPIKDKQQPGQFKGKYKFRYATLPAIHNHIRETLTKNGIFFTQRVSDGDMVTRLIHRSGQWMDTGHVPMPDIKGDPAAIGAIISFFKRYSLTEAVGLAADDDDSGEQGDRDVSFHARGAPQQQPQTEPDAEEPPVGWGTWARNLIDTIATKGTEQELDELRDVNVDWINAVGRVDRRMQADVKDAFRARRATIGNAGF